jgi:hypothetical protein
VAVFDLIDHCTIEPKASELLFELIFGKTCRVDEAVADHGAAVAFSGIVGDPQLGGAFGGPFLQKVRFVWIDTTVVVASEIDVLGLESWAEEEEGKEEEGFHFGVMG